MGRDKKRGIAITGPWQPVSLTFLRSRACAELSPHGAKLLLDVLGLLSTNAGRNGDISLTPKTMNVRGWSGRATLRATVQELLDNNLLFMTKQGSRLDCSLFACTLYPLDCDLDKLDVRPGCYATAAYTGGDGSMQKEPTETHPARWRQARKTETVAPPRNAKASKRTATVQTTMKKVA